MMARTRYICLTGMDGTGKTTQAQEVIRRCREAGIQAGYLWARWEPFFLRPVTAWYFRKKKLQERGGQDFVQAKSAKARMLRRGWVRKIWQTLSLLDYWLTKRPRVFWAARKWPLLVCDRYVYDYAVDQAINLGQTPAEMVRDLEWRIFRFFPRPDVTVVLLLPAEEGARRKSDGTGAEYLKAREPYYRALLDCSGAKGVDASGTLAEVQAAVWEQVKSQASL